MALKMTEARERIIKDISIHLECNIGRKYLLIVDTKNKFESYLKLPEFLGKNIGVIMLEDFDNMKVKDCWEYTRITFDVRYFQELLDTLHLVLSESPEKIFNPIH